MERGRGAHRQPQVKNDQKTSIRFSVCPSGLGKGRNYYAKVQPNRKLTDDAVIEEMSKTLGEEKSAVRFQVERISEYLVKCIRRGDRITFGGITMGLTIAGGFSAMNEEFDPKKHKLCVTIQPRYELSDAVAYLNPVNVTDTIRPKLESAYCSSVRDGKVLDVIAVGVPSSANGAELAISDGPTADGLWLEDLAGRKVAEGTILECSVTRLEFKIVGDVEPGEYNLVVRVPNLDRKTFSIAKRKIRVVSA